MMHIRNLLYIPGHPQDMDEIDMDMVNAMYNHKNYEKEIIIDYNDWTDTRNVPNEVLDKIGFYFKRSMVVNKSDLS